MARFAVLLLGAATVALLGYFCIHRGGAEAIQARIEQDVRGTLAGPELSGVTATVNGRDVHLAGTVASAAAKGRAVERASAVPGVRHPVHDRIAVREVEVAPPVELTPAQRCQEELDATLAQPLGFQSGVTIEGTLRAQLETVLPTLQACSAEGLVIDSRPLRTDPTPDLAHLRAMAVADFLAEAGVPPHHVVAIESGAPDPADPAPGVYLRVRGGSDATAPR